jgi:hypothetical protein
MPTKYKNDLLFRKKRLSHIKEYENFSIGKYLIATGDYSLDEMLNTKISDLKKGVPDDEGQPYEVARTPLWDWFTIVNTAKNKIWYCDFSMPYHISEDLYYTKEQVAKFWALHEVPSKMKINMSYAKMYQLEWIRNEDLYQEKINNYLANNNWDKTFEDYKNEMDKRKNWNSKIPIVYSNEKNDMGIIIPFSFSNKTIKEIFEESINIFFNGKQNNKKEFYHLIEEPEYKKFM